MAVRISRATGNWLTAGTWGLVDATSYNNSETTTTALTTSYAASSGSTTGAITTDGVALKLSVRTGTTGTMSVHLAVAGVEVTGTLVTINTADLPVAATADLNGGWVFFKFASPVTLLAATSYTVEAKTSSSAQVSLYSTATTNWSRAISTTTTGAPAAGDDVIVTGEYTGAGTSNALTVTMNETASTNYGSATTSLVTPAIAVCSKGTLKYGSAAATAYNLKVSGCVIVYSGGEFDMGTVATPIPRDSSAKLNLASVANVDFGLTVRNLGTFVAQGLSRTSGKNIYICKLVYQSTVTITQAAPGVVTWTAHGLANNDIVMLTTTGTLPAGLAINTVYYVRSVATNTFQLSLTSGGASITTTSAGSGTHTAVGSAPINATTFGVDTDTGWLSGDQIAVADTGQTNANNEVGTLNGGAGASSFTVNGFAGVSGGLAAVHGGMTPIQAEIILLTRNVQIFGTSASVCAYIDIKATAVVTAAWAEFKWLGSATANKRGIDMAGTGNNAQTFQYCSRHSSTVASSLGWNLSNGTGNSTISNCVAYNVSGGFLITVATTGVHTFDGNVFIMTAGNTNNAGISLGSHNCTFTNNTVVGSQTLGVTTGAAANSGVKAVYGTWNNNTCHSCTNGFRFNGGSPESLSTITNTTAWRMGISGIQLGGTLTNAVLSGLILFGAASSCVAFPSNSTGDVDSVVIDNLTTNGDAAFPSNKGILTQGGAMPSVRVVNSSIGVYVANGFLTGHANADVATLVNNANTEVQLLFHNTSFGALVADVALSSAFPTVSVGSLISSQKHNKTAGLHKSWGQQGILAIENSTVHTGSQSMSMTPNANSSITNKLRGPLPSVAVANGATVTYTVWIYKSAAYNGNQPRLVVKRNDAIGISADTVLATYSGGTGAWASISGTTVAATDDGAMEFIVDCDYGTGGVIYVDSASAA